MILVTDNGFNRLGAVRQWLEARRTEEINGENTLEFSAILDEKVNAFVHEDVIFEYGGDYFDVAMFDKKSNSDGTYTVDVEAEHVSYRLNREEYNREYFTEYGTPDHILGKILEGTGFSVGIVEYDNVETYSAQEPKSRRQILMEYVAYLGGEAIFDKFTISIVRHRGSMQPRPAVKDLNVKVVSKSVNKRKKDEDGNFLTSYKCSPVYLPDDTYALGDRVILIDNTLGVKEDLRVVSIAFNPYDNMDVDLVFANYVNGLEDSLFRIETSTVIKNALYNGIRIGPEYGFEAVRNDKRARAYMRSDGLAMQSGDGSGTNWRDRLYYAYISETDETILVYDGVFSADLINVITNLITPYVYADNGAIVNAIVRRLRTDLGKPWLYLNGDKSDVHYQDIGDTPRESGRYFIVGSVMDGAPAVQFSITSLTGGNDGVPLWWFEGNIGGSMTTAEEYSIGSNGLSTPVMAYQYEEIVVHSSELKRQPEGWWGVRDEWGRGEDEHKRGQGVVEKTSKHMMMVMNPGRGNEIGGVRISSEHGVELFNPWTRSWEYPGGGINGGWDRLEIADSHFTIGVRGKQYTFDIEKDDSGRIIRVIDDTANRVVDYV